MKIVIDKVLDKNIYFSTDYGMAKGIWKGTNRPIQKEYCVELDIDGLYSYDNVFVNNTKEYQMRIFDGKNQLTLLLLEYDEDGCATFQLGDSIIEIETAYEKNTGVLIADEFERLAVDYLATPAVLCKNHGPFTWGKDAKEAVHNAVVLEEVAKMAARCEQIDPKVNPAPQELQDKHYYRKHGKNAYYGQSR